MHCGFIFDMHENRVGRFKSQETNCCNIKDAIKRIDKDALCK